MNTLRGPTRMVFRLSREIMSPQRSIPPRCRLELRNGVSENVQFIESSESCGAVHSTQEDCKYGSISRTNISQFEMSEERLLGLGVFGHFRGDHAGRATTLSG